MMNRDLVELVQELVQEQDDDGQDYSVEKEFLMDSVMLRKKYALDQERERLEFEMAEQLEKQKQALSL